MGVPNEADPSIRQNYIDCSPISFVSGLTDEQDLLIIHGTGDDNVHYQHAELLIDQLVKHDKYFDDDFSQSRERLNTAAIGPSSQVLGDDNNMNRGNTGGGISWLSSQPDQQNHQKQQPSSSGIQWPTR